VTAVRAAKRELDRTSAGLIDLRFRALLGEHDWCALPEPVRARFSKHAGLGETTVFAGIVTGIERSLAGRLLAQAARSIGAPFPLSSDTGVASVVTLTEDGARGGQTWSRLYARRSKTPQIIHTTKLFAGPTGLEERVGRGVGMTLTVSAEDGALVFRSREFFLEIAGVRMVLPRWLTPGSIVVRHSEEKDGWFSFDMDVEHPLFGRMIHQHAIFKECRP